MRVFLIGILVLCIVSCKEKKRPNRIDYSDGFSTGGIEFAGKDTILNGLVETYDMQNNLLARDSFKNNLKSGECIEYWNNQVVQKANYLFGYLNGWKYNYDSVGTGSISSYYYFGRQIGPRTNYKNGMPWYFRFINFDGRMLYDCKLQNDSIVSSTGSLMNYTTNEVEVDGKMKIRLSLYVIEPPFNKVTYTIYDIDEKLEKGTLVTVFESKDGFVHERYLDLLALGHKYIVRTQIYQEKKDITMTNDSDLNLPVVRVK
jgi:hypothetical protein